MAKDASFSSGNASSAAESAYAPKASCCLDVSAPTFLPDDDIRVELLFRKIHGESLHADKGKRNSDLIHLHDLPPVISTEVTGTPLNQAPGADRLLQEDNFVKLAEFATLPPSGAMTFRTVTKWPAIEFILLTKPKDSPPGARWENPSISLAQDFINDKLCKMLEEGNEEFNAYERTGKWGLVSIVYLKSEELPMTDDFRRNIAASEYKGYLFDSYPKDLVTVKAEVTILLRSSMRTFITHLIPKMLFGRNKEALAGSLKILSTRFFPNEERSTRGESKTSWRTIELLGDEQFMRCLARFPERRPFFLGVNAVQIRGGLRPPEPEETLSLGKRVWKASSSSSSADGGIARKFQQKRQK